PAGFVRRARSRLRLTMGRIQGLAALAAVSLSLAACSSSTGAGGGASPPPSARAGFGGPAATPPSMDISDVSEYMSQSRSNTIYCSLTKSAFRCDIVRKTWTPPAKPADCDLDWGNGMYIDAGKAGITCAGDPLIGSAKQSLDYGKGLRSGTV